MTLREPGRPTAGSVVRPVGETAEGPFDAAKQTAKTDGRMKDAFVRATICSSRLQHRTCANGNGRPLVCRAPCWALRGCLAGLGMLAGHYERPRRYRALGKRHAAVARKRVMEYSLKASSR